MSSETTSVPVVDSGSTKLTLVPSTAPAIPLLTGEDQQQSVISAVSVTGDVGDKQLLAMPTTMTIPVAETAANGTMSDVSENFFRKRLPVPKRERSATKGGRAYLVSYAWTSAAHMADIEAREAQTACRKMPKSKHTKK